MRLLLAEDEEAMSEAVADILEYHKYQVDTVYDGNEALDYIHAAEYDGIMDPGHAQAQRRLHSRYPFFRRCDSESAYQ